MNAVDFLNHENWNLQNAISHEVKEYQPLTKDEFMVHIEGLSDVEGNVFERTFPSYNKEALLKQKEIPEPS